MHEGEGVEGPETVEPSSTTCTGLQLPLLKGDPDLMEAQWQSKVNHVQDIHELNTPAFPCSTHPPLEEEALNKGGAKTRYKMLCTI